MSCSLVVRPWPWWEEVGWGGEQRKDGAKFVIKAEFHPSSLPTPSAPASSNSSLPFKSGCGCHNGRSSPHLSAGQEARAEKDPGPDYAPFTFKTCSTPVHMLARSALSSDCKLKIWKGSSLKHVLKQSLRPSRQLEDFHWQDYRWVTWSWIPLCELITLKYRSNMNQVTQKSKKNKSRMVLKKQTHIWCAWRWNNLNIQQVTFKTIKDFLSVYMHFRESYLFRNFCCVVFSCSASSENCSLRSGRKDLGRIADRVRAGQRRTRQA